MKSLNDFIFEYKIKDEIEIKCEISGKQIDPAYILYDKTSLDDFVQKHKNDIGNMSFYFIVQNGKCWTAKTKIEYHIDIYRMNDRFLSSDKVSYSYDDIVSILETGDKMLIVIVNM